MSETSPQQLAEELKDNLNEEQKAEGGHHIVHMSTWDKQLWIYDVLSGSARTMPIRVETPHETQCTWVTISPSVILLMGLKSCNDAGYIGCE